MRDSLFYFDTETDTIMYVGKGKYKVWHNGAERPEVFPSQHEASDFLSMLVWNENEYVEQ